MENFYNEFQKTCKSIASFVLGAGMMFSGLASNNLSKALFTEECRDALIRLNNKEYWKNFIESLHKLPNARPDLKLSLPEDYDKCIQWQLNKSTEDFARCFKGSYKISNFNYASCRDVLLTHLSQAIIHYTAAIVDKTRVRLPIQNRLKLATLLTTVKIWVNCDQEEPLDENFDLNDFTDKETQKTKIANHINESLPCVLTRNYMVKLIHSENQRLPDKIPLGYPLRCCMNCIRHLIWLSCDVYTNKPSTWALTIARKLIESTEKLLPEALEASVRIADYVVNELNSNREDSLFNLNPENEEKRLYDYITKTLNEE